jgi:hypothetical protein
MAADNLVDSGTTRFQKSSPQSASPKADSTNASSPSDAKVEEKEEEKDLEEQRQPPELRSGVRRLGLLWRY